MSEQYLDQRTLENSVPAFDFDSGDLISSDTYNETKILEKVKGYSKNDKILLCKSAIQISVIGAGGRQFGQIRHKDVIYEIQEIFDKLGVKYRNVAGSKLEEDDLTPRRLVRLFRFQIRAFIEKTHRPSYLWLKYAEKSNQDLHRICFPGAEHLVESSKEADFLLDTYKRVDDMLETTFVDRLRRVFIARGILDSDYFKMKL